MIDRPPPAPRFGLNVGMVLAFALAITWLVGERGIQNGAFAQSQPTISPNLAFVALIVLVFVNGLFVASEHAVEVMRSSHVKHVRDDRQDRAARLQELVDGKAKYVTACLLASRLARLGLVFFVLVIAQEVANPLSTRLGWSLGEAGLGGIALIGIPVILVNLVFGELVPKSYAGLHPHWVGLRLFNLIRAAAFLLSVPANMIVSLANVLTARFGGRADFGPSNQAEDEIKHLVESAEETGEIESDERELLHSVFEFTDTVAREIMTPRVDLDAVPVRSEPSDVVRIIQETGHSRIPLFEETDDQIVGIIHAKDLLMAMVGSDQVDLRSLMRPALFVPEGKSLHELLQEMRVTRSQMAVVQDEFGGTAGIVTIEDIVEQLVGDIVDEYDEEEPAFVNLDEGWLVNGKTHLDDVNDQVGSEFNSEEFDTIGGFVFGQFGRQPKVGESIEVDGYRITVEDTDGRRVQRIRIEALPPSEALAAEAG